MKETIAIGLVGDYDAAVTAHPARSPRHRRWPRGGGVRVGLRRCVGLPLPQRRRPLAIRHARGSPYG